MNWDWKHKLIVVKMYLDIGYNHTAPLKWLLAAVGISSGDPQATFWVFATYGVFCLIFGVIWLHWGWQEHANDVSNYYNPLFRKIERTLQDKP